MNTDLRQFQKAQKQTHEQAPNLVSGQTATLNFH